MNKRLVWAFCAVAMALGLGGLLSLFIPAFQDLNRRKPQRSAPIQERDDRERIF